MSSELVAVMIGGAIGVVGAILGAVVNHLLALKFQAHVLIVEFIRIILKNLKMQM